MLKKIFRRESLPGKIIRHGLFPALFYFIFFCLLTYPLIFKFFTHFYADTSDGLQNVWNLWWVNFVILRPDLYPSLWHTNMLHWPFGTTLLGHTLNPFNGFMAAFLLRFLSLTASYNTIVIFSFVLAGATMYWLSYYLTRSFWASLIAGFIFTFSNYHFMHAQGHLQLVSLEWIPLFVLCWYVLLSRPGVLMGVAAAIVLWMILLCDYYYFFYCILAGGVILVWHAAIKKDPWFALRRDHFLPLVTFGVVTLLLAGPVVGQLIITNYWDPLLGPHDPLSLSLDLLALIIPGGHWLFNQWTQSYWSKLPGNINESSVYLGLPVFAILGYVWIKRKTLEFVAEGQLYLWYGLLVFFFVFALGPALHVAGKVVWDKAMPYTILVGILPFLKLSGVPVRMVVMVILSAAVISAMGLRDLLHRSPRKIILVPVLLAVLLFEALPKPLPATRIEVPGYVTTLAGLPNDGGVLDQVTKGLSLPMYFQTIYRKPMVFGYLARLPTSVTEKDQTLAETIRHRRYGTLWDTYHIRYIITYDSIAAVPSNITVELVYDQENIRIYRLGCNCQGHK
jgi:hypothetical protein